MELALNLVWFALACSASLAWLLWNRRSASQQTPTLLCGLMVVICILALLFPVISISDDLSQTLSLAEGSRIQDILKAPELRSTATVAAMAFLLNPLQPEPQLLDRTISVRAAVSYRDPLWTPVIENRPPPHTS